MARYQKVLQIGYINEKINCIKRLSIKIILLTILKKKKFPEVISVIIFPLNRIQYFLFVCININIVVLKYLKYAHKCFYLIFVIQFKNAYNKLINFFYRFSVFN